MAHVQQARFVELCIERIPGVAESGRVLEEGGWAACGGGATTILWMPISRMRFLGLDSNSTHRPDPEPILCGHGLCAMSRS